MKKINGVRRQVSESIREIVFGLEDGLVSTLGAVIGIAAGTESRSIVILSGLVLIAVESTSMSAGSYLSSKAAGASAQARSGRPVSAVHPIRAGAIMGVFYFFGGVIPVLPYFFFPVQGAWLPAVICTAATLFCIGVWSARHTKRGRLRSGVEMVAISLAAAAIGYGIGTAARQYFGIAVL